MRSGLLPCAVYGQDAPAARSRTVHGDKERAVFSDEAVGQMRQIAFGWEETVMDVLNVMWEIHLNDRGYQHQGERR